MLQGGQAEYECYLDVVRSCALNIDKVALERFKGIETLR